MKYNFNRTADRLNTSSIKWDVKENELPMWVADMDFMVIPEIQDAIIKSTQDGAFGYTYPTKEFFDAYQYWWKKRHHVEIPTSWMIFASGVVSALDSIIRTLTKEDDGVLLLTPVYHTFFNVIKNNHRKVVTSTLAAASDYSIDYQDVENKIKQSNVKVIIFCNPHNPVGRIWKKEEIKQLIDICEKYNVFFISDEIHCDITDPSFEYCSALSVSDNVIA